MDFTPYTAIVWDDDVDQAWVQFSRTIATMLTAMTDDDILSIDMHGQADPGDGGALPYIQVMAFDEGQARRCEVSSNDYLSPVFALTVGAQRHLEDELDFTLDRDEQGMPEGNYYRDFSVEMCSQMAQAAVRVLRETFSVDHPRACAVAGGVPLEDAPLPDPGPERRMATYYEGKSTIYQCRNCSWTGPGEDLVIGEPHAQLADYDCPKCRTYVTYFAYPTYTEISEAARAGDAEAQKQLADVKKAAERDRRAEKTRKSPVLAPEALNTAEEVRAVLTMEDGVDDDGPWFVLLANDLELHREHAFWESVEPMERLLGILRKRYKDRLVSFDYHDAYLWMCGDILGCVRNLAEMVSDLRDRDGRSPDPASPTS